MNHAKQRTAQDRHSFVLHLLEMLASCICVPRKKLVNINHGGRENAKQCAKTDHDQISNGLTERRLTTKVRSRTREFIEGGGTGVYGTGKGWLRHGLDAKLERFLVLGRRCNHEDADIS